MAALKESTLVTRLVPKVTAFVPDNILSAPMVWFGTFATEIAIVALKASISVVATAVLAGDQLFASG